MSDLSDRARDALFRLIDFRTKRFDYHAVYPSKVISQAADGTLELQPDSKMVPGIRKVPVRLGVPGVKIKVKAGARCQLGFENGNPKLPYAGFWEPDQLSEVSFTGAESFSIDAPQVNLVPNGIPNARQGDIVAVGGPGMVPIPILITLTTPVPAGPTATVPAGTPISGTIMILSPLYGAVTSGAPNVKS